MVVVVEDHQVIVEVDMVVEVLAAMVLLVVLTSGVIKMVAYCVLVSSLLWHLY